MIKKLLLTSVFLLGLLLLAPQHAQAQQITVPGTAVAGSTITVGYENPALANTTVTVTVSVTKGGLDVTTQNLSIKLDKNGKGSTTWKVPAGEGAFFEAPGATKAILIL